MNPFSPYHPQDERNIHKDRNIKMRDDEMIRYGQRTVNSPHYTHSNLAHALAAFADGAAIDIQEALQREHGEGVEKERDGGGEGGRGSGEGQRSGLGLGVGEGEF